MATWSMTTGLAGGRRNPCVVDVAGLRVGRIRRQSGGKERCKYVRK